MSATDLSPEEKFVLVWLGREDRNQLGECKGRALDRLVELRLAQIDRIDGIDADFWNVACTDDGYQLAAIISKDEGWKR